MPQAHCRIWTKSKEFFLTMKAGTAGETSGMTVREVANLLVKD